MIRNICTFDVDLPHGGIWDDRGNVIEPPGKEIAITISCTLQSLGNALVYSPENHEDFGWEFCVKVGNTKTWLLIQGGDPWLLIISPHIPLFSRLLRQKSLMRKQLVLNYLQQVLSNNIHFSDIKWFNSLEYETNKPGCASP
jgi:hypothetical protein